MTGQTHAVVGANAAWIAALAGAADPSIAPLILVGAIAGLLPDLDAGAAKIHFIGGGLLSSFRGTMKHRGFMHSFLCTGVITWVSFLFLSKFHPLLPVVIGFAYISHLIIDGLNFSGVPYLYPWSKNICLVPKFLRTPVKGFIDQLLFIFGIFGIIILLLQYASKAF